MGVFPPPQSAHWTGSRREHLSRRRHGGLCGPVRIWFGSGTDGPTRSRYGRRASGSTAGPGPRSRPSPGTSPGRPGPAPASSVWPTAAGARDEEDPLRDLHPEELGGGA